MARLHYLVIGKGFTTDGQPLYIDCQLLDEFVDEPTFAGEVAETLGRLAEWMADGPLGEPPRAVDWPTIEWTVERSALTVGDMKARRDAWMSQAAA